MLRTRVHYRRSGLCPPRPRVFGKVFTVAPIVVLAGACLFSCTKKKSEDPPNTVRLYSVAKIKGLDPIYADDNYAAVEVNYAYEGLLQYHYLKRPYVLIPNLAESMPTISKDGKTITFKIKQGVLFEDDPCFTQTGGKGRELVADDFIYSWKRLADPRNVSTGWWIFDGKVVGLNDWRDAASKAGKTDYAAPIDGLKALDRYTLQIRLTRPNYQFLYMLAMPFADVVPHEAVDYYGKELINHAVGTGPYRLTEYNPNLKLVWDKNPTYRHEVYPSEGAPGDKEAGLLADAGQPLPRNDRIITSIIEESSTQWLNFLAGKLDWSVIPKDNFGQALSNNSELSPEMKAKNIRLLTVPRIDITHTTFNMADPLLGKNKLLRQALSLAYDTPTFISLFYSGKAIPAQGPIPPTIGSGYDPNFKNPYRQYNVEKAKKFLAKAGYPDGRGLPPLEYITQSDSTDRQITEFEQKMFAQIGVQLKIDAVSWPEFTKKLQNREGQIWAWAWLGDYPDAENFLQLFYSKNASPGPNDANYSNPEFDRLYEKALTMPDSPQRTALYKQMVSIVTEDCPWIFDSHRLSYTLVQPWLKNVKINDFEHSRAKYFRVDSNLKK